MTLLSLDPLHLTKLFADFAGTFQLMLKGCIIGIVASAPMGPVGILCLQRTMQKGRIYGIVTGAGAALSDILYALVTGLGMTVMMTFIERPENIFWIKVGGSILLFCFGWIMLRSKPREIHTASGNKGTLLYNFLTSFLVTISNPLIIFLFIALFAQLTFVVPTNFFGACCGYMSIVAGAMLWWCGLTYIISKMRDSFGMQGMQLLNRCIGAIVVIVSIIYALSTILKIRFLFF